MLRTAVTAAGDSLLPARCRAFPSRRLPLRAAPREAAAAAAGSKGLRGNAGQSSRLRAVCPPLAAAAAAGDLPLDAASTASPPSQTKAVVGAACSAMLLAALHRVCFSVLAVPIQQQFGLSLPQMGLLQSALLVGYVVGQIPLGLAADRVGGARLLTGCLFLWSLASLLFGRAPSATHPFAFMMAARAALGLGQSCIMPAVSSLSARWLPAAERSRGTSTIYAFYSVGTVAGLALTPFLAQQVGWPATFGVFGLAGMASAALTVFTLPEERPAPRSERPAPRQGAAAAGAAGGKQRRRLGAAELGHLALLCFTHSIISWAFFILLSWIPSMIHSLHIGNLETVGVLSALPWLATAVVSVLAGSLADVAQARWHLSALKVRRLMQGAATLGAAVALLPLALLPQAAVPAPLAVGALTAAVAAQGFNYAGFHSYVQDVAPRDAGLVLGITNTCGTLVGIAGNVLTGVLAAGPLGYQGIFALTVVLHLVAFGLWWAYARGGKLQLT